MQAVEEDRLASLDAYGLNDLLMQPLMDDPDLSTAVRLACDITGLDVSEVNIITSSHQVAIAAYGAPQGRTPRADTFCSTTMHLGPEPFVAEAVRESMLADLLPAQGDDPIRSYVSAPLIGREGLPLGTICAWSRSEHSVSPRAADGLARLAAFTMRVLELRRMASESERRAMHDPLTGLANRTLVEDRLQQAIVRAGRVPGDPMVAFIDLDHFKAVNDTWGHQTGDRVLVAATERLLSAVRAEDTVARYGGDEFLVLCERIDAPGREVVTERLRAAFDTPLQLQVGRTTVTVPLACTVGVASYVEGDDPKDIIKRADAALYGERERIRMDGGRSGR